MAKYFENFNLIKYNGSLVFDITKRAAILNQVFKNKYSFYPYRVKDGMRAEVVAEKYYGNPEYVWLVYYSNNIVDPYYQWPMDHETLESYIKDKYGSLQAARQKIVAYRVNWYEDTRRLSTTQYNMLEHYERKYWDPVFDGYGVPVAYVRKKLDYRAVAEDGDDVTSPIDDNESEYWTSISAYEDEEEKNANKASIRLLDKRFLHTALLNLKDALRA